MKPSVAEHVACTTFGCDKYREEYNVLTRQGEHNASRWSRETIQTRDSEVRATLCHRSMFTTISSWARTPPLSDERAASEPFFPDHLLQTPCNPENSSVGGLQILCTTLCLFRTVLNVSHDP